MHEIDESCYVQAITLIIEMKPVTLPLLNNKNYYYFLDSHYWCYIVMSLLGNQYPNYIYIKYKHVMRLDEVVRVVRRK